VTAVRLIMVCRKMPYKADDPISLSILARNMHMRAEEIRALAEEMHHDEPKAIMLRIAEDYEKLVRVGRKRFRPLSHSS
jgi:hypothetical protein